MQSLIEPKITTLYPDTKGYTGFSIFVWQVELERDWGRVRAFVLEGRYYVQGVLLDTQWMANENERFVMNFHDELFKEWKIRMDEVTKLSEDEKQK